MGNPERWIRHKPLPQDIEISLEKLSPIFKREGVLLAYLFGSLASKEKPCARARNDVDLAVLTSGQPAWRLWDVITDTLGTDRLDLVDLRQASPVLRFEILRTGKPIYVSDEAIKADYELATLHEYRDTAPMRRNQAEVLRRRMAEWSRGEML